MNFLKSAVVAGVGIFALSSLLQADEQAWTSDLAAAKKEASASHKDLLLDFTGSDWCSWCMKLDKEVFQKEAFKEGVKNKFVLVKVDFPRDNSKLSEETQQQNEKLADDFAIEGFPTIMLCDAQGRPYARTGYQEGGAEKYVSSLDALRKQKTARDEALTRANQAKGVDKAKALLAALRSMGLDDKILEKFYGDILKQIPALDPKDETGFSKEQKNKKRLKAFDARMQSYFDEKDMDGALGCIDSILKEGGFGTEQTQQLMMAKVAVLAQIKRYDDALKGLDKALIYAPKSPLNPRIEMIRMRLKQMADQHKAAPKSVQKKAAPNSKE